MAREKKQRLSVDAAPALCTNPFAALDLGSLPAGPAAPLEKPSKKSPTERLLMRRETAHRGGKTVIVLEGFSTAWGDERLAELLHDLKTALGCGGKVHGRKLEIQGEQAERLQPLLEARGFAVKRGW